MIKILTIDSEFDSVSKLGYLTSCHYTSDTNDTIIRWGNSELYYTEDFKKVINPAVSVNLNCHKHIALITMSKVVTTPKIFLRKVPRKRVLIRPIAHSNGSGFRVTCGPIKIPYGYYGTAWISTKLEYRVWFAWDKTICAKRTSRSKEKYPCRSNWSYSFINSTPDRLHNDVMKAAKEIGLTLGAADVLVKDGKYIFLELNSAPTIDDDKICEFYKSAIASNIPS